MANGKLNDREFSVVESAQGFAEFTTGVAENAQAFTPKEAGDAEAALDFLAQFKGEFFKAAVNPPMEGVETHWIETRNGKKYSVIACDAIPALRKAGYKPSIWTNFHGRVPFLNLAFKKAVEKAPAAPASNKFAPKAKPARKPKFAPK